MSAIALHDTTLQEIRLGGGKSPRRPHLRLVQPGEVIPAAERTTEGLVLTRRGRLAVTLTVATIMVLAVAAILGMLPAAASGGHTVVVQPGQTLSQIAVTELPELPMDRAIVQIQVANDMNSLDVQAGTKLEIPQH